MQESKLQGATLLSWTLQVWADHRRGAAQGVQEAAIAYCMQQHSEWWDDWSSIGAGSGNDPAIVHRLIHIHNDAAIRMQVASRQPKEIADFYYMLQEKGFTEFESIHTLAVALTEETAYSKEHNESFSHERYLERASGYVKQALSRPNLARISKGKVY